DLASVRYVGGSSAGSESLSIAACDDHDWGTMASLTATTVATAVKSDFNGDLHTDIVWRHTGGTTVMWEMDGASKVGDTNLNTISTNWSIQGIGDFNGDGKSDIVWRNDNGTTVLWEMNGGQKLLDVNLSTIPTDWHIQGIAD